jgi:hypothetical protein
MTPRNARTNPRSVIVTFEETYDLTLSLNALRRCRE